MKTIYHEISPDEFVPWNGTEKIEGNWYSANIAALWPEAMLIAIGLYFPADAEAIPEGKAVTAATVKRVEGVVRFVHTLVDVQPVATALREPTRAQCESALYHYKLPDGTNPLYFAQYEDLLQNHPYPPLRIWAKGAATWRENHPYVMGMAAVMEPPIDDTEMVKLFDAASALE